ncbi:MAG: hypothetical protein J07HX5_00606, partial [halophilic archaeon J07HX5]
MCPRLAPLPALSIGFTVCCLGVLVVFVGVGGVLAGTAATQSSVSNETITTEIQLQPNGDANWDVSVELELTTDNEVTAFRETATRFKTGGDGDSNEGLDLGLSAFRAASDRVSDRTGREMSITGVDRTSDLVRNASAGTIGAGRLTLSFSWTNFATVDGNRLVVNDVLTTEQGPWLERLGANERLLMRGPPDYLPEDAGGAANITDGTLCWKGPITFDERSLAATFDRLVGPSEPPGQPGDNEPSPGDGGLSVVLLGGGVAAAVATAVLGYLVGRRFDISLPREPGSETAAENEAANSGPAQGADSETAAGTRDRGSIDGTAGADTSASGGENDNRTGTKVETGEPAAPELLSDEERVERLLRANGGRMKQAVIVEETGWSNAKVSQLLSTMKENDR